MSGLPSIPDHLPLGSFHVLEDRGSTVIGRHDVDGWTMFVSAGKVSLEQARAVDMRYVRPILEGRRIVPET